MSDIVKIKAREILDSRGSPTVEVELHTEESKVTASVPSGASTGVHEAVELRDKADRYNGRGVLLAVENINERIAPRLLGLDAGQQHFIDVMMQRMDGTPNKAKLGANAILAVSMAVSRAAAADENLPLFRYISRLAGTAPSIPFPYFNVLNGGRHAGNALDFQEYMVVAKARSFRENLRIGSEIYHTLKLIIAKKYGLDAVSVGDEGGFAPPLGDNEEPLVLLEKAIITAGHAEKVDIAIDCASSEFFCGGKYLLGHKGLEGSERASMAEKKGISGKVLGALYSRLIKKHRIFSIEDPFAQDDWESWQEFMKKENLQIVGDDLLVTNTERIKEAAERQACNALLLKLNQIGTVSESIEAASLASRNRWKIIVSHRSGETEDSFIADLAAGLGCGHVKSGAPCRGERLAKYNQLLRIEESLYE